MQADQSVEFDLSAIGEANDYLVKELFDKTQDEVDNMTVSEFDELLKQANELKNPSFTQES